MKVIPFIYSVIPILLAKGATTAAFPTPNIFNASSLFEAKSGGASEQVGGKPIESWGDRDSWSIVRPSTSEPRVSLEQEHDTLFAVTVEVDFLLANADKAALAKVAIFPYGQCGVDAPVVNGSGTFCHTDEQGDCVEGPDNDGNNGPVLYTATYRFQDLNTTTPVSGSSSLWNSQTDTLAFCGRLSLALAAKKADEIVVSFHDMNFEYYIDLKAEFSMTNAPQASAATETISKSFSPAVETCLCDDSNICLPASDIPAIPMGGEVKICIKVPTDEDFEILGITEWKLEQENTGAFRYAIQDESLDGLTTMHSMGPHEVVVSTALDSQFFQEPDNSVTLSGLVLVQPQAAHIRRRGRELYSNIPAEARAAEFSISLKLLPDSSDVSHMNSNSQGMPSDGIILLVVSLFALLSLLLTGVLVVRHMYGSRGDHGHVLNTGALDQGDKDEKNSAQFYLDDITNLQIHSAAVQNGRYA